MREEKKYRLTNLVLEAVDNQKREYRLATEPAGSNTDTDLLHGRGENSITSVNKNRVGVRESKQVL